MIHCIIFSKFSFYQNMRIGSARCQPIEIIIGVAGHFWLYIYTENRITIVPRYLRYYTFHFMRANLLCVCFVGCVCVAAKRIASVGRRWRRQMWSDSNNEYKIKLKSTKDITINWLFLLSSCSSSAAAAAFCVNLCMAAHRRNGAKSNVTAECQWNRQPNDDECLFGMCTPSIGQFGFYCSLKK